MSATEPAEASTLFERYFADGDLEGLMSLYEEGAVFPSRMAPRPGTTRSVRLLRHTSIPAPSWCSEGPLSSPPETWR